MNKMGILYHEYWENYQALLARAASTVDAESLDVAYSLVDNVISNGGRIFVCGNGGSAAISDHFGCDHLKGNQHATTIKPNVISLTSNVPLLTAVANDNGFENVFSDQLKYYDAHGQSSDMLVAISSSGNSQNIINALQYAKDTGMPSVAMVGFSGGRAKDLATSSLYVKSNAYGIVEDVHQMLMHCLAWTLRTNYHDGQNITIL